MSKKLGTINMGFKSESILGLKYANCSGTLQNSLSPENTPRAKAALQPGAHSLVGKLPLTSLAYTHTSSCSCIHSKAFQARLLSQQRQAA